MRLSKLIWFCKEQRPNVPEYGYFSTPGRQRTWYLTAPLPLPWRQPSVQSWTGWQISNTWARRLTTPRKMWNVVSLLSGRHSTPMKSMVRSDVPEGEVLYCHCGISTAVGMWVMDTNQSSREATGWLLQKNASLCWTDSLGEACHKPGTLRWTTES